MVRKRKGTAGDSNVIIIGENIEFQKSRESKDTPNLSKGKAFIDRLKSCLGWKVLVFYGLAIVVILVSNFLDYETDNDVNRRISIECEEQEIYAIEAIRIHADFAHKLSPSILFIRQSFVVVVTGLFFYYFVKRKNSKLSCSLLLILLLFATLICHANEGILGYWQTQHLNKVKQFQKGLEVKYFPDQHMHIQQTFVWKDWPYWGENASCTEKFKSILIIIYNFDLSPTRFAFYFATLILAILIATFFRKVENK